MRARCSRSIVLNPPIPDAMNTPTRVAMSSVTDNEASSIANWDAAMANWMKTSIFLTSFLSMNWSGSNFLTSPAIRAENCAGVEVRDRTDAAAPGAQGVPVRLGADAEGRYKSHAGDDDSPAQTSDPRFPMKCSPLTRG